MFVRENSREIFSARSASRDLIRIDPEGDESALDRQVFIEEEEKEDRALTLLEKGGFVMLWCIGIFTIVKMIIWFESTLKPAVFALFFVVCLEPSVKAFSRVFLCIPCRGNSCCPGLAGDEGEFAKHHPCLQMLARFIAVVVVLGLVSTMVWLFIIICLEEVSRLQANASIYADGLKQLYNSSLRTLNSTADQLPKAMADSFRERVYVLDMKAGTIPPWMHTIEDWVGDVANSIVGSMGTLSTQILLCFLYVLFALCQPPKEGLPGQVEAIVRRFIFLKTLTNAMFAICIVLLLWTVKVDLAGLFGVLSWFLNFIPEIGPFISIALPMPLIMLDSRMSVDGRLRVSLIVLGGQLSVKFIIGNIVETYLFGHDARFGEVHPVVMLLFIMLCGEIWGATGMLVSVPLLALLKLVLDDELRDKIHHGHSNRVRAVSDTLARGLRGDTSNIIRYSIVYSPGGRGSSNAPPRHSVM